MTSWPVVPVRLLIEHNAEIQAIFDADRADRADAAIGPDVAGRDHVRQQRVHELLAGGRVRTGRDHFHAAMVLQHGSTLESYRTANSLARRARQLGEERGAWLAAASYDRWLVAQGRPQYFGTQYRRTGGRWVLGDTDPSATDERRRQWGTPSLAEAQARADRMSTSDDVTQNADQVPVTIQPLPVTAGQLARGDTLTLSVPWSADPISVSLAGLRHANTIVQLDLKGPNWSHLWVQLFVPDDVELEHPDHWT